MPKPNKIPKVIGVASGKGGVGKTSISTNLAVALTQRNHKVMVLDADLGMANAQIALGVHAPFNIGHVLRGEKTLEEVLVTTPQGVVLVPGASGLREMAALSNEQVSGIIRAFDGLNTDMDYLLVDIAAGIAPSVLDFMSACHHRLVVVCDQPSAVADAYGLIKVMTTEQQLDEIYLVPNMVIDSHLGRQLHRRMNDVCMRFLGANIKLLGCIPRFSILGRVRGSTAPSYCSFGACSILHATHVRSVRWQAHWPFTNKPTRNIRPKT